MYELVLDSARANGFIELGIELSGMGVVWTRADGFEASQAAKLD